MKKKEIRVKVLRKGHPLSNQQYYQTWTVPLSEGMSVLNTLRYINEHYDGGLAYYSSCRIGICQGCFARVNGKTVKICTTIVGDDLTIEPLKGFPVIKDLVVDLSHQEKAQAADRDK
jgi:succinate dehydrogenase/fumarate reductase iron-sulfur protein